MLIFLSWIVFSILVAVYANNKGRSGAGFFFLSLLLSPVIGFIMAAVSSPQREKVAERSGMKKCPACAEYVQGEAFVCRFCTHKFEAAEAGITASDIDKMQQRLEDQKADPREGIPWWKATPSDRYEMDTSHIRFYECRHALGSREATDRSRLLQRT